MASSSQTERALLLRADLRYVRHEAERCAGGAAIHTLSNYVLTIQAALRLVDGRLAQGPSEEIEMLLELAEGRLNESRALIAQARRRRFTHRRAPMLATA